MTNKHASQQDKPNTSSEHDANEAVLSYPSVREHGTDGYTEGAVGGFGEAYSSQVAHGGDSNSPGVPSHSEHAQNAPGEEDAVIERALRKSLAHAHIDSANLTAHVRGSVVHLRGTVHRLHEKTALEVRARAVRGVSEVVNDITVLDSGR